MPGPQHHQPGLALGSVATAVGPVLLTGRVAADPGLALVWPPTPAAQGCAWHIGGWQQGSLSEGRRSAVGPGKQLLKTPLGTSFPRGAGTTLQPGKWLADQRSHRLTHLWD